MINSNLTNPTPDIDSQEPVKSNCALCGNEFTINPKAKDHIYCSTKCSSKVRAQRYKDKLKAEAKDELVEKVKQEVIEKGRSKYGHRVHHFKET